MESLKDTIIRVRAPLKRIGLQNRDFSILANNCWGGIVSRDRRLPYNSPTCGTYFFSKEYLRFLSDPHRYLELELEEVPMRESRYAKEIFEKEGREDVTVGRMGDVEVVLLHYPTFAEAKAKWEFRNKLFLTVNPDFRGEFVRLIPDRWHEGCAVDDIKSSFRVLNVNEVLNNMKRGNHD